MWDDDQRRRTVSGPGMFVVAESHDRPPHQFNLLKPGHPDWLATMATVYRALRTSTEYPLADLTLNGIDVLDTTQLERAIAVTQLPTRATGCRNFAVERSDFGEVALALAGEQLRGYAYGYRSTRDRELVRLPGRGIDQIGVKMVNEGGESKVVVSLGEAKVSSEPKSPPKVVDKADDSLRNQHLGHLAERDKTCAKLYAASRRCTEIETQRLLQIAAALWEKSDFKHLVVKCTSMLVRPKHGSHTDFGSARSATSDFAPGEVDFMVLTLDTDNIESTIDEFLATARGESLAAEVDPDRGEEVVA